MVIQCPACQSRFRLPDEKVGPAGVVVRCAKCSQTFAVHPPGTGSPPASGPLPAAGASAPAAPGVAAAPGSLDATAGPDPFASVDAAPASSSVDAFADAPSSPVAVASPPSLETAPSPPPGGTPAFDFASGFDFGVGAAEAAAKAAETSRESSAARPPELVAPAALSVNVDRPSKDRDRRKSASKAARAVATAPVDDTRGVYRLLLALFFAGAVLGGYASLTGGTFRASRVDRARLTSIFGRTEVDPAVAGLTVSASIGEFLETPNGAPRIYVARGTAVNRGSDAKGTLVIRGRLLDASGEVLAESSGPCGRELPPERHPRIRSAEELARALDGSPPPRVGGGGSLPCALYFFDAPPKERIVDVELEVVSATPAAG